MSSIWTTLCLNVCDRIASARELNWSKELLRTCQILSNALFLILSDHFINLLKLKLTLIGHLSASRHSTHWRPYCRRPWSCPTRILKESLYLTQIPAIMILELPYVRWSYLLLMSGGSYLKLSAIYCVKQKDLLALVKGWTGISAAPYSDILVILRSNWSSVRL